MHFVYPALLQPDPTGEVIVSFRDLPECLTSGSDEAEALVEAADALEEAIAGRIKRDDDIPAPSLRQSGERRIAVPSGMAAKAALALALRESGLPRAEFATLAGTDEGSIKRMLDPKHQTTPSHIERALRAPGAAARHGSRNGLKSSRPAPVQGVSGSAALTMFPTVIVKAVVACSDASRFRKGSCTR